jgi:hypothetical protein
LYDAGNCALRKVDQKHLESFEMWCWWRIEKISWTDRVRSEEVLHRAKEDRNILHPIKRREASCIGHILRRELPYTTCYWRKIEWAGRRGRRRKQLVDDLKEKGRNWKLKEEALDRTMWRTRFGRSCGPVIRQNTIWMIDSQRTHIHVFDQRFRQRVYFINKITRRQVGGIRERNKTSGISKLPKTSRSFRVHVPFTQYNPQCVQSSGCVSRLHCYMKQDS